MSPTKTKKKTTKKSAKKKAAPARKTTAKKAAKKKPAAKKASKKAAKKTTAKAAKKATGKATKASKKAAGKATKKATGKAAKGKAGRKAKAPSPSVPVPPRPREPGPLLIADAKKAAKLGQRWTCWSCGASFYDLNRPEPQCPRCDADPRSKPKEPAEEKPAPKQRNDARALAALDDETEVATPESSGDEDIEIIEEGDGEFLDEADSSDSEED